MSLALAIAVVQLVAAGAFAVLLTRLIRWGWSRIRGETTSGSSPAPA